ncbi:MAG: 30S ribosomal protein S17 [Anaerolineales bacterium]|nr:30S ribosomal protein S17 [Anaerolineales bacterium]
MTNTRRRLIGEVVRTKMQKTITVRVNQTSRHPLYGKVIRTHKDYLVHDEKDCRIGDKVKIVESRPISRRKRWAVEEVLRRADLETVQVKLEEESEVDAADQVLDLIKAVEADADQAAEADQ